MKNVGIPPTDSNWGGEWRMCGHCTVWLPLSLYVDHIERMYTDASISRSVINNAPSEWRREGKAWQ